MRNAGSPPPTRGRRRRRASRRRALRPYSRSRRTTSAPEASVRWSCFAVRIDQSCGNRLARRLAAPQHELEHGVEALALLDRGFGDRFGLLQAQALVAARVEDGRVPEQHEPRPGPHLEVAKPQLLDDEAQRLIAREPL